MGWVCAGTGSAPHARTAAAARAAVVAHVACKFIRMGLLTTELCWNIGLCSAPRNGETDPARLECRDPIGNDWIAQRLRKAIADKAKGAFHGEGRSEIG